jgi:nitrilase
MTTVRVAAVQASYVLMDREATLDRVAALTADAAARGAALVVFPEAFVPGTPLWMWTQPVWDGDAAWSRLLAENTVTIPGPATDRLAAIARDHGVWLAIGVQEREPLGTTIYNTLLYLSPEAGVVERHRKLIPTGAERAIWGMGDGSTLRVVDAPFARIGGLICWENYMPLARFYLYAQGVDIWLAPTLANGDSWVASMRHIAFENRMFVLGVNPLLHADHVRRDFPQRGRLLPASWLEANDGWIEPGSTVIVGPNGDLIAGPVHHREETLIADLDLRLVATARRMLDPVGHYNRADVFACRSIRRRVPRSSSNRSHRRPARPRQLVMTSASASADGSERSLGAPPPIAIARVRNQSSLERRGVNASA